MIEAVKSADGTTLGKCSLWPRGGRQYFRDWGTIMSQ